MERSRDTPPRTLLDALPGARGSVFLTIAALTALAWRHRFVQDDAYISFRYAENMARGLGLVWNPGERVEGYTNFLWTLLMVIPHRLGIDPVGFSQVLGVALFAGTLAVTWSLARRALASPKAAWLAIVLLGANATFSAYATGGLETQLQALLVTSALLLAPGIGRDDARPATLLLLSLVCAAALLTRLDSALPIAAALASAVAFIARAPARRAPRLLALLAPLALIVGAWLAWKLAYYGDVLPNTFYSKAPALAVWRRGARYVFEFLLRYGLLPIVVVAAVRPALITRRPLLAWLAAVTLTWACYVIAVGGDFMEFRFLVPALPLAMILVASVLSGIRPRWVAATLALVMIGASFLHAATFRGVAGIEYVKGLESHVSGADDWRGIGRALRREFAADSVVIAVTAAGAIPYESKLPSVDMLGLCDRWVARHGAPVPGARAGHRRIATHRYLHERGVHLVVGQPLLWPGPTPIRADYTIDDLHDFWLEEVEPDLLPASAAVIEMPVGGKTLAVIYLEPSAAVERVIRARGLVVHPIVRAGHQQPPRSSTIESPGPKPAS